MEDCILREKEYEVYMIDERDILVGMLKENSK